MSFTPNLPASGQSLGFTKTPIKDNFAVIRSTIAANHYDVNDPLAGKHKFSIYPSQGSDPATTTTEAAIYTKTLGQVNAVFRSQDSAGTGGKVYQLTRAIDGSFATFGTAVGWTFLPGGLLMQYGFLVNPTDGTTITFPVPFTTLTGPYSITLAAVRSNTDDKTISIKNASVTNIQFKLTLSGSSVPNGVYWQAIGV